MWTVPAGVEQLRDAFTSFGTSESDFLGRLLRIRWLLAAQEAGWVSPDLRVVAPSEARAVEVTEVNRAG